MVDDYCTCMGLPASLTTIQGACYGMLIFDVADGWVLAAKYPNVTVYSVSSQDISNPPCAWPAPLNHHPLYLHRRNSTLPFPDNYFDVISTKSFSAILKASD